MLKKNYFYLIFAIIATTYNAIQLMFYPELTPTWFIRVLGGLFVVYTINYILDIYQLYLKNKIKKLDAKICKKIKEL